MLRFLGKEPPKMKDEEEKSGQYPGEGTGGQTPSSILSLAPPVSKVVLDSSPTESLNCFKMHNLAYISKYSRLAPLGLIMPSPFWG